MPSIAIVPIIPFRLFSRAMLAALVFTVTGCSLFGGSKQLACPQAGILKDGSRLVKFRPGPGRDLTDVVYEARVSRLATNCDYNRRGVDMAMEVSVDAARGPASATRSARIPYFVAIMNPADAIIAKQNFHAEIKFPANVNRGIVTESLNPKIPMPRGQSAARYRVVVGLQLTPDELAYNRRQKQIPDSARARILRPPLPGATGTFDGPDEGGAPPERPGRATPGREGME